MRWPWRRRAADEAAGPDADDGGAPAPSAPEPARRPVGEWRDVPALQAVSLADATTAAEPLRFVQTLSTRWQVPPALEQLGHEQAAAAPAGAVLVAPAPPVVGYPDAPVPVWPTVAEAVPETVAAPSWSGPARVAADGAAATSDDTTTPFERPAADLVGAREPLTSSPSGEVASAGPAAPAPGPVRAAPPGDLELLTPLPLLAAGRRDAVEAATDDAAPVPAVGPAAPPLPAPARRSAAPAGPEPAPVPEDVVAAPAVRPLVGRTPVRTLDGGDLRAADPRPDRSGAEPEVAARRTRPAHSSPAGTAADDAAPSGVPDWFTSGAVQPRVPDLPSAASELFPTGRDATAATLPASPARRRPHPDPWSDDAGSEADEPGAAASDAPVARPRRVPWPQPAPEPEDPGPAPDPTGPAAVRPGEPARPDPLPLLPEAAPPRPPDAQDAPDGWPARPAPHAAHAAAADVAPRDVPAEQGAPELPLARSAHRPAPLLADPARPGRWDADGGAPPEPPAARWTPPEPSAGTWDDESDDEPGEQEPPVGATTRRRVLKLGAPLPPPARAVRRAEPLQGLAAFVAAASGPPPGPEAPLDGGVRSDASTPEASDPPDGRPAAADVLELLRPRAARLEEDDPAPSSVRELAASEPWPDHPEAAPVPADPRTVLDDLDDDPLDDDDEDASAAAVYERVRERLRHELLVERERAALLAD